jgi:hypothetical protein
MWKAALAGALLATTGATLGLAQEFETASYQRSQAGSVITEGHIARLKGALRLTAEQQRHWPAVASALRGLSRASSNAGTAQGVGRATAAMSAANAMRRVAAAARPLINSLSDQQRQAGMQVIRSSGLSHLASAL